jgi:O-antigen/teichoic acid export membrane protein
MTAVESAVITVGPAAGSKDGIPLDTVPVPASSNTASLDRSFVRGIAWVGSVKWLVQLVTWGTTIVVARILTPADYGLLTMATVLLEVLSLLSESGMGLTVITLRDISKTQVSQINGAAVAFGFASFALTCLAAWPVSWFYRAPSLPPVILALGLTLAVGGFRVVPAALLQKDLRFKSLAKIDATQGICQSLATITFALLGFQYWSLALGSITGVTVGTTLALLSRPHPIRLPNWKTLRPIIPFTRNVLVGRLFWFTYQNSDFIVAGKRLGAIPLGAYSYAWTLASMPVDKITALLASVTPAMFAHVQHDKAALRRYFLTVTEGLAVFAFPLTIGIALVARDLVPVVFGDRWIFMIAPLQLLAIYSTIRVISPTMSQVLVVTGDTKFMMYMGGVAAVTLPTAFYIGSRWGTVGIAAAWIIAHPAVVYFPFYARLSKRLEMPLHRYLAALWPAASSCLVMTAAVLSFRFAVEGRVSQGIMLGAEVAAGAVAYVGCLLLFQQTRIKAFLTLWRANR